MKDESSKTTRVVIVDDHPMLRERLALLIEKEPGMVVSGEADNVQQGLDLIESQWPDIAIVDLTLKGSSGLELIKDLKARAIPTPVLVLSMHDESLYAERALRAGALGYITKQAASEEVLAAIHRVLSGNVYLSRDFTEKIVNQMAGAGLPAEYSPLHLLADRELEVFRMIGLGKTTREIATALGLGLKTVDTYRERIKQKLNLKNAAELYRKATCWVQEQG
ncbi:MAG: response regulator [Chthoniobacteraceae bacterium]